MCLQRAASPELIRAPPCAHFCTSSLRALAAARRLYSSTCALSTGARKNRHVAAASHFPAMRPRPQPRPHPHPGARAQPRPRPQPCSSVGKPCINVHQHISCPSGEIDCPMYCTAWSQIVTGKNRNHLNGNRATDTQQMLRLCEHDFLHTHNLASCTQCNSLCCRQKRACPAACDAHETAIPVNAVKYCK